MYLVVTNTEDGAMQKYKSKNYGRKKFQIDLAMALMEEGITRDWTGDLQDNKGRPAWNRKRGYVPCGCQVCFFCKHGHTAGIDHGKKTARPKMFDCVSERVHIRDKPCRCVVCYKKQGEGKKRTRDEAMNKVHQTRMGYPAGQKVVCADCWQEFQMSGHKQQNLKLEWVNIY